MTTFESYQDAKDFVWGLGIHDANEFQVCGDLWYFETAANADIVRGELELARAREIDIRPIPTDVGLNMVWFREPASEVNTATVASQPDVAGDAKPTYAELQAEVARLQAALEEIAKPWSETLVKHYRIYGGDLYKSILKYQQIASEALQADQGAAEGE